MYKNNSSSNKWILWLIFYLNGAIAFSQTKSISITIDDVPNTIKYQKDNFEPKLLNVLESLKVPFTIFINEHLIYKTALLEKNKHLLEKWSQGHQAILGNHTFSHLRYSEVGFDNFTKDIEKGEILTSEYAKSNKKEIKYFRFPFNDLGKDSIQHVQIRKYLKSKAYTIAPFTVENSDWMFDAVYRYYLETGETEKAKAIGKEYVKKTLELLKFYNKMTDSLYNRPIKHIYLCHDNAINADYLAELIEQIRKENYDIVSFEESLTDPIYQQEDTYFKKWGISWLYRWMNTQKERVEWMSLEPDLKEIEKIYAEILKK
jgi:peptidoglycan-N-acetylglucosamine deacetylase